LVGDDPVSITVISCLYGSTHDHFLPEWVDAVTKLDPAPHEVILAHSQPQFVPQVYAVQHRMNGGWRYPQAYYLTKALGHVTTDWVWIHDIDDLAFPDALEGIDQVEADVFQMGYLRSDGEVYLPPQFTAEEFIACPTNRFVSGSCVRTSVLREVGGFPDCALQDWALWLKLAHAGAKFAASDRPRFHYRRHPQARGEVELTLHERVHDMAEMEECLAQA
jgi:hypothetical protein